MRLRVFTLDVFTTRRFAGNPLGVVLSPGPLAPALLQAIAFEIDYAETTFLQASDVEAAQRQPGLPIPVRIFTPTVELPFAGHPTLGTAWLLCERLSVPAPVSLRLGAGDVLVTRQTAAGTPRFAFRAPEPELLQPLPPARAAALAGIAAERLLPNAPCGLVRGGPLFAFAPLADPQALGALRPDLAALRELGARHDALPCVYAYAPGSQRPEQGLDLAFEARMFFDAGALREDPATGSAAVALGAWLRAGGEHPLPLAVSILQGAAMGRPSQLYLDVTETSLQLAGSAVPLLEGVLDLPDGRGRA